MPHMDIDGSRLGISSTQPILKYNQNHDASSGQFASAPGGSIKAVNSAAAGVAARAAIVEPEITATMQSMASAYGAQLDGLAFRLKTKESLARKIKADAHAMGVTPAVAAANISDSVRYTMKMSEGNYAKVSDAVIADLKRKGYGTRVKNFWQKGDPYQGINVAVTHPNGTKFELQFHTQESLAVKEAIHIQYEKYRVSNDNGERQKLWHVMSAEAAKIPIPPGVESIPDLKLQHISLV